MPTLNTTRQYQSELAAYCRTGQLEKIPGIVKENVPQYRRLVMNVVDDMLQNAYPLTHQLLQGNEWDQAVADFFSNHACQSPQVWYMPKEFYEYLSGIQYPLLKAYPFLEELLWFEWIEVELFMMEDIPVTANPSGNLLADRLVLNPEHRLLAFTYPVHQKNPGMISGEDKGSYFVIAHRNSSGEVLFTGASAAVIRMIEYLVEANYSVNELYTLFEEEYTVHLTVTDRQAVLQFLKNAVMQQLIAGFDTGR